MDAAPASRQGVTGAARRAATVRRLIDASQAEFGDRGYARATVERICRRAGTTVQTLYDAVGSKRALLRLVMVDLLSDDPEYPRSLVASVAGLAPDETVQRIATSARTIAERAQLGWRLYRDAAAVDDEIAGDWTQLQALRRDTVARMLAGIPDAALRDDLDRQGAIDLAWTASSPDSWQLLVVESGRTPAEFEAWLTAVLRAMLRGTEPSPSATAGDPRGPSSS